MRDMILPVPPQTQIDSRRLYDTYVGWFGDWSTSVRTDGRVLAFPNTPPLVVPDTHRWQLTRWMLNVNVAGLDWVAFIYAEDVAITGLFPLLETFSASDPRPGIVDEHSPIQLDAGEKFTVSVIFPAGTTTDLALGLRFQYDDYLLATR